MIPLLPTVSTTTMYFNSFFGRDTNNPKIGLVGCANIGKTATFNALTESSQPSENYPFCTIDPALAYCTVEDPRIDHLIRLYNPKSQVKSMLRFVDIAGLVAGAAEGQGLGNAFLSHIASVDAIAQVIRVFQDDSIAHTEGGVDPLRDIEIISSELLAKDISEMSRHLDKRSKAKLSPRELKSYEKAMETLKSGMLIRRQNWNDQEIEDLSSIQLLTAKPMMYLLNIGWEEYLEYHENKNIVTSVQKVIEYIQEKDPQAKTVFYSAILETAALEGDEESKSQSNLQEIISSGYHLLRLIPYFTVGKDEVRSWTIRQGTPAIAASSVIHTSFPGRFINAKVASFQDFESLSTFEETKNINFRTEGKSYQVQDGDIVHFQLRKE